MQGSHLEFSPNAQIKYRTVISWEFEMRQSIRTDQEMWTTVEIMHLICTEYPIYNGCRVELLDVEGLMRMVLSDQWGQSSVEQIQHPLLCPFPDPPIEDQLLNQSCPGNHCLIFPPHNEVFAVGFKPEDGFCSACIKQDLVKTSRVKYETLNLWIAAT